MFIHVLGTLLTWVSRLNHTNTIFLCQLTLNKFSNIKGMSWGSPIYEANLRLHFLIVALGGVPLFTLSCLDVTGLFWFYDAVPKPRMYITIKAIILFISQQGIPLIIVYSKALFQILSSNRQIRITTRLAKTLAFIS